jgi:hypothetical protein
VCKSKKAHKHSHHGHTGNTRHSPRNGFNSLYRALPGEPGFFATVADRSPPANLTPASGCQDHTTSPSASAPSSEAPPASTASRPAFVTIASRPFVRRDGRGCIADLGIRAMSPVAADWHDGQKQPVRQHTVGWVESFTKTIAVVQNMMGIAEPVIGRAFARPVGSNALKQAWPPERPGCRQIVPCADGRTYIYFYHNIRSRPCI